MDYTYDTARSLIDTAEANSTSMVLFVCKDGVPQLVTNMPYSSDQLSNLHQFVTDTLRMVGEQYGN